MSSVSTMGANMWDALKWTQIPTDTTWLRRDVTAFSDLPEVDALLIVSLFSKFLLSLPSVIRLVYVCFVRAALGAAFGGVFTAFLAVFESFFVVFWDGMACGVMAGVSVEGWSVWPPWFLDWSVWSSLFGLTCVVVIVGLICVIVIFTVFTFLWLSSILGTMSGFFPPFCELSGVLSRDWWRGSHMTWRVWFFPLICLVWRFVISLGICGEEITCVFFGGHFWCYRSWLVSSGLDICFCLLYANACCCCCSSTPLFHRFIVTGTWHWWFFSW